MQYPKTGHDQGHRKELGSLTNIYKFSQQGFYRKNKLHGEGRNTLAK